MEIHLISTMTAEDENRLAPAMLAAIGRVLSDLPVSYAVRIETTAGNAIHQNHTASSVELPPPASHDAPAGVNLPQG